VKAPFAGCDVRKGELAELETFVRLDPDPFFDQDPFFEGH